RHGLRRRARSPRGRGWDRPGRRDRRRAVPDRPARRRHRDRLVDQRHRPVPGGRPRVGPPRLLHGVPAVTTDAAPSGGALGRVGLLGGGVMGEAILAAVLRAGVDVEDVAVSEPSAVRANELAERYGVRAADGNARVAGASDVVVIALKPHDVAGVLAEIAPSLRPGTLVVSVAAGLTTASYEAGLPDGTPVVRVMPNTPAVVGQG